MTVAEAKELVAAPLKFGSEMQIAARNLLREVDDCRQAIIACDADHLTVGARRSQKSRREIRYCECVSKWAPECEDERGGDWSVVEAAIVAALGI